MSLKSETAMICGNCMHANERLGPLEIQNLKRRAHFKRYLNYLRRYADVKVLCRKENIEVCVLEEACAFWKRK